MRLCLHILLLICCCASTALAEAKTKAALLLSARVSKPGETVFAGVRLKMPFHWHTYWKNSGDLPGANTTITWQLPAGVTAGETEWPVPEKDVISGITSYQYIDEVLLITPLKISDNAPNGPMDIKAAVAWTECDKICIQGKANVAGSLTIGDEVVVSDDAPTIQQARTKLPRDGKDVKARAFWENNGTAEERPLMIEWNTGEASADFFPFVDENFEVGGLTDISKADGKLQFRKIVKKTDATKDWPKQISGLLVENPNTEKAVGYNVALSVDGGTKAPTSVSTAAVGKASPPVSAGFLLGKLFAAFLGGLILNIMPCVLPVIALKIFGFVQQSKESHQQVFKLGLIYTLGIVVSFLILAGMVIAVQKAGGSASWGMQMQYPHYRLALTIIATLVALNLFGVFEVTLSGRAMGAASGLASRHGASGAFFNGVLATALATPCTAPFLAPAVGFAFAQPAYVIVLLFLAIALGLASPYLLLSWRPNWLRFLPKPGPWMEKFKIAMGFPMLAAAIWLFSFTASSFGEDGVLGLGLFLLMMAISLWVWGEFVQRGTKRKILAAVIAFLILIGGYGYGLEDLMHWRKPARATASEVESNDPRKIAWKRWSVDAVAAARAEGHPVLVDFTAKWCLTCQSNKKTSVEVDSVRRKLKEINAVTFIGDNTDPDPSIIAELKKYDRAGVPLVLVFPADSNKPAIVLPDGLFTAGTLLEALDKAAK